jgi:hypothetical protein
MPAMPDLRATLDDLSDALADAVLRALRASTVPSILASTETTHARGRAGRPRGVTKKTAAVLGVIVAYVKDHPGTSGEEARTALGIEKSRWSTYLVRALAAKQLRKEGSFRNTKYWAV